MFDEDWASVPPSDDSTIAESVNGSGMSSACEKWCFDG